LSDRRSFCRQNKEMSEAVQITKKQRLTCEGVEPGLPLELWQLIIQKCLSRSGMDWIENIPLLMITCKLFNQILCDLALQHIEQWVKRDTEEWLIPSQNPHRHIMPLGLNKENGLNRQTRFNVKLSGGIKHENSYTIRFKFKNGTEKLFIEPLYGFIDDLLHGSANFRVIIYFTDMFLDQLREDFEEKREELEREITWIENLIPDDSHYLNCCSKDDYDLLKHMLRKNDEQREEDARIKLKIRKKKIELEEELKLLDVFSK